MENNEEQPIMQECNFIENNSNDGVDADCKGSSLGKFKNSDELFKAYTNLEREFTKKCQRIKELEAFNDNKEISPNKSDNESFLPEGANNEVSKESSKSIKDMLMIAATSRVSDTTSQGANEINAAIDGANKSSESENKTRLKDMDKELRDLIYSDVEIRNRFIENYLNEIQSQKSPPLIVNTAASSFCVMPKQKPQSLQDAGDVVKEMLKN